MNTVNHKMANRRFLFSLQPRHSSAASNRSSEPAGRHVGVQHDPVTDPQPYEEEDHGGAPYSPGPLMQHVRSRARSYWRTRLFRSNTFGNLRHDSVSEYYEEDPEDEYYGYGSPGEYNEHGSQSFRYYNSENGQQEYERRYQNPALFSSMDSTTLGRLSQASTVRSSPGPSSGNSLTSTLEVASEEVSVWSRSSTPGYISAGLLNTSPASSYCSAVSHLSDTLQQVAEFQDRILVSEGAISQENIPTYRYDVVFDQDTSRVSLRGGGNDKRIPRQLWFFMGGVGTPPTIEEARAWRQRERNRAANENVALGRGPKPKRGFWREVRWVLGGHKVYRQRERKREQQQQQEANRGQGQFDQGQGKHYSESERPPSYRQSNPGSYPQSGQGSYQQSGQGSYQRSGKGSLPKSGQGSYQNSGQGSYQRSGQGSHQRSGQGSRQQSGQGSYKQSGQGSYQGSGQGSYQPSGQHSYQDDDQGSAADSRAGDFEDEEGYDNNGYDPEDADEGYDADDEDHNDQSYSK